MPVKLGIVVACAVLFVSLAMPTAEGGTRETPPPDEVIQGDESEPVEATAEEENLAEAVEPQPIEAQDASDVAESEPESEQDEANYEEEEEAGDFD